MLDEAATIPLSDSITYNAKRANLEGDNLDFLASYLSLIHIWSDDADQVEVRRGGHRGDRRKDMRDACFGRASSCPAQVKITDGNNIDIRATLKPGNVRLPSPASGAHDTHAELFLRRDDGQFVLPSMRI